VLSEQGNQGTLNYDYDPMGNRTQIALPDGRTLRSLYYGSGHLLQVALDDVTISEFERDNLHHKLNLFSPSGKYPGQSSHPPRSH
jgi:YD repeat-containing protein